MKTFWYFTPAFTKTQLQHTNASLSSYITHPTGAGPGGPPAHMDGPPDHQCLRVAKTFFYESCICHSYYPINKAWLLHNYLTTIFYTTNMVTPVQTGLYSLSPLPPPLCFCDATILHHISSSFEVLPPPPH